MASDSPTCPARLGSEGVGSRLFSKGPEWGEHHRGAGCACSPAPYPHHHPWAPPRWISGSEEVGRRWEGRPGRCGRKLCDSHLQTGEESGCLWIALHRVRCSSTAGSFSAAMTAGLTPGARAHVKWLRGPPDELNELTSALRTVPGVISTAEASAVSLPGGPSPCWPLVTPPPTLGAGVSGYVQDIPLGQNGPCRSRWLSPSVKYSDEQCGTAVFLIQKWLNVGSFIRFRWLLWPLPPSAGDLELIACPACADTCLPPRNLLKRKDGWEPRAD